MSDLKTRLFSLPGKVRSHWKTPPAGRYMPYKEIVSLSVGGIGVRFIVYCVSQMILSTGNALLSNTIGIEPVPLYIIYLLSLLSGFPLTALRANMIDNTRGMKGKYRPYILTMGIPTAILGALFVLMPYEKMGQLTKCAVVLLFNIGFQFFYNFYVDAYESLINVLSPNSIERSDVLSIRSVVENLSPSLANIAFPLLARLITGQNTLYDIRAYRFSFPPMLLAGLLLSVLVYVNTEEKIVQAKSHYIRVKFSDALRAVAQNKYFWIISAAGWIGFLEGAFANIMQWMYNYQGACSAAQYSLVLAISGNASFWPNLAGPFLIRKWGKKRVLIVSNLLNVVFIAAMLPIVRSADTPGVIWPLLAIIFINQFLTSLGHLMTPSVNADIRDYQQYISGERIDGMFAAVGLIGSLITMATGFVLPAMYSKLGLNAATAVKLGYSASNVYDVLYDAGLFTKICSTLVLASVAGAALNVIPYFFYDLSEEKQKAMVTVLKLRAAFEDAGNGKLSAEDDAEIRGILAVTEEKKNASPADLRLLRRKIKEAKKHGNKTEAQALKADYVLAVKENEAVGVAAFVAEELEKYRTPEGRKMLALCEEIANAGPKFTGTVRLPSAKEIRALPRDTETRRNYKRFLRTLQSDAATAKKTVKKHGAACAEPFDAAVFDDLFAAEDTLTAKLRETAAALKNAKTKKDPAETARLKKEFAEIRAEKQNIAREIREATERNSLYHRAAAPYLTARKTLREAALYEKNAGTASDG